MYEITPKYSKLLDIYNKIILQLYIILWLFKDKIC